MVAFLRSVDYGKVITSHTFWFSSVRVQFFRGLINFNITRALFKSVIPAELLVSWPTKLLWGSARKRFSAGRYNSSH